MTAPPRPPAHIEPYVRALGVEGAVHFLIAFGGAPAYLAETPGARNSLVPVIGASGLKALRQEIGTNRIDRVPVAGRWVAQVWFSQGRAVAAIARELRTSDKTVRGWLKAQREDCARDRGLQMDLFGAP